MRLPAGLLLALAAGSAAGAELETGVASVYRDTRVYCPGEAYRPGALEAAHRSLPCGSLVEVTNRENGRTAVVRIVDRGPFTPGRILDLTPAGAIRLGLDGLGEVILRPILGFEDRWRALGNAWGGPAHAFFPLPPGMGGSASRKPRLRAAVARR